MNPTREVAAKVLSVVDAGLCAGVGSPEPGQMCVEAAVCYALGEPHGDKPSCVGRAVRSYKITLNDKNWSSNAARAKGMRRIAIAQLGSDTLDQQEFAERISIATVREIISTLPRITPELAAKCQAVTTRDQASDVATEVRSFFDDLYRSSADAAAAAAASYAAAAAAYAAASYAAASYAAAAADAAASYAASYDAASYAAERAKIYDERLSFAAEMGVRVLTDMNCPGVQWLDLADAVAGS